MSIFKSIVQRVRQRVRAALHLGKAGRHKQLAAGGELPMRGEHVYTVLNSTPIRSRRAAARVADSAR